MFIKDRFLQNITFIANNRVSSKKNFKHRVFEFKNKFSATISSILI